MQFFFFLFYSEHSYLECNMDTLLTRLDTIYSEFNTILEKNRGFLISISVTAPTLVTPSSSLILGGQKNITRNRGISEAILFGHLAESMSNQFSSILLLKYPALLCLVRNILEEYFLTPLRSPQNTLKTCLWEVRKMHLISFFYSLNFLFLRFILIFSILFDIFYFYFPCVI